MQIPKLYEAFRKTLSIESLAAKKSICDSLIASRVGDNLHNKEVRTGELRFNQGSYKIPRYKKHILNKDNTSQPYENIEL